MSETRPHTGSAVTGSVLGSYRILGEISTGGMGTVFRAEHVLLGRPAAVKLLRPDLTTNPGLVQRFVNEAKAVTACKHPGIVEVYDFGYTPDGHAFIVMELLEGEPLGHRLAQVRLSEFEVIAFAHGIASALKAAHKVGVIHRDLKPDNVFLVPDPDGGPDRTKVLDFGIAKLGEAPPTSVRNTQTGALIGTPLYMAPEQARAAGAIDHRADLYSLGCILYHMLVGRPPFVADGGGEIIALQLFGQVEPPSQLVAVEPALERLVLRLLEKDPVDRFANAAEVVLALAALDPRLARSWPGTTRLGEIAAPTQSGVTQRLADDAPTEARPRRSAKRIVAGAIAVIVAGVIGFAAVLRDTSPPAPPSPPPDRAPASAPTRSPAIDPVAAPAGTTPVSTEARPAAMPPTAPPASPASPTSGTPPATPAAAVVEPAARPASVAPASESPPETARPAGKQAVRAPGRRAPKAGPASPADEIKNPYREPGPATGDKAIEVIHEIRQVDPMKPGAHTQDGSPMETDVGFERKRSKPKDPSTP